MSNQPQSGFTLLEVLVTLVIVSIGLLGLLGLQTVGLANTQVSYARNIATYAADDIAERMRANPLGVINNEYSNINNPSAGNASPPEPNCREISCNPSQMAAFDAFEWDQHLGQNLSNGQGRITCLDSVTSDLDNCSPNSPHSVIIIWSEQDRVADRNPEGAPDKCDALNATADNVFDRCFQTTFLP